MKMDDVTPEMVIEAARRVQKRLGRSFTAKDVWYELEGIDKRTPFYKGNARIISNLFLRDELKNYIHKVGVEFGSTRYVVEE